MGRTIHLDPTQTGNTQVIDPDNHQRDSIGSPIAARGMGWKLCLKGVPSMDIKVDRGVNTWARIDTCNTG